MILVLDDQKVKSRMCQSTVLFIKLKQQIFLAVQYNSPVCGSQKPKLIQFPAQIRLFVEQLMICEGEDDGEVEAVLQCSESYAQTTFVPPDNMIYDVNPHRSNSCLLPIAPWRGLLLLTSRKSLAEDASPLQLFTVESCFPELRSRTLRFLSAFASLPLDFSDLCRTETLEPTRKKELLPIVRVEKVVRHPVTLGCMKQSGMVLSKSSPLWNLHWGGRLKDECEFGRLLNFQRVNHFPGTWVLGRKDALARHLRKAAQRHREGRFDEVAPVTYSWPIDLPLLQRDVRNGHIFIVKPPARARGEGISLFSAAVPTFLMDAARDEKQPQTEENDSDDDEFIVQRYLTNPLLINGFKVDLRVYVVCTSFDPLRLYVYNDGLVRFAAEPFPPLDAIATTLDNVFQHLTNYSINKQSRQYVAGNTDGSGSKWSFYALKRYFECQGWDWDAAWRSVHDVIIKTFIAVEGTVAAKTSAVRHRFNCFELYGFDIMLDNCRVAHLIEVNVMPSLSCGAAIDKHVKGHMIADMLTLVGLPVVDKEYEAQATEQSRESRRVGVGSIDAQRARDAGNNIESRSVKYDAKKWQDDSSYFAQHATSDDKAVLRDTEEELRRSCGFHRVFPTSSSRKDYGRLFDSCRHYNRLLWAWEEWKAAHPRSEDLAACVAWLANAAPFPVKHRTQRAVSVRPLPRCAKIAVQPRRVSASPRPAPLLSQQLPPIDKRPIPVSVFTFLPVNKTER